jgi:radical SAM enzyme (TIGR01210 family)
MTFSPSRYSSFIAECMNTLHSRIPPGGPVDVRKPAHIDIREEHFRGQNVKRAVVFLLTNGCEWALKSGHGCTMCGHIAKQTRTDQPISAADFVEQFQAALGTIDSDGIPVLNIYNNGSFFNDNEIPSEARRAILSMINRTTSIQKLLVECRPEFITEAVLYEAKELMPDKEFEIAIGLETADDVHRMIAVNKGFSLKQFTEAANIITRNAIELRSYVLLKPPFLSEQEAIAEAIQSINTAFSLGVGTVSLEAMTEQRYTLVEYLIKHRLYRVPWLWSIIEVVRQTAHLGRVVAGLFQFYPSPELVPNNCSLCNDRVMDAIVQYDRTLSLEALDGMDCECKVKWGEALLDGTSFRENLERFFATARKEGLGGRGAIGRPVGH